MTRNSPLQVFEGGWKELENALFTDNKLSVSNFELSYFIKPDGTQLFRLFDNGIVETYPLSIPYDLNSVGAIINSFVLDQPLATLGIIFKPDGTKMFILTSGVNPNAIYEYDLPIPWDTSSIVDTPKELLLTFITAPLENMVFSRDGDFVFIVDTNNIHTLPFPTPWDITSFVPSTDLEDDLVGSANGITIKPEGDRLYISDVGAQIIREFELSTPNVISTATLITALDVSPKLPVDIQFRSNGKELFVFDFLADEIVRFHTNEDWRLLNASHFTNSFDLDATLTNFGLFWKHDGKQFMILGRGGADSIKSYTTVAPWNVTGAILKDTFLLSGIENSPTSMWWTHDGLRCFIVGNTEVVKELIATTPWDVSTLANTGITTSVSEVNEIGGLFFRKDGRKMFVCGTSGGTTRVAVYDLPAPFDIDNAGAATVVVISATTQALGMFFKPDGKLMYVMDFADDKIDMYKLVIPWDITTQVFVASLDVAAINGTPAGLFIREDDGKKIFFTGTTNDKLTSFDMTKEFNNAIITEFGDELVTDTGEILVYA